MTPDTRLEAARQQDAADPLTRMRDEFHFPPGPAGEPVLYFCGNSLGLQPRRASVEVARVLADWQRLAVLGHHGGGAHWMAYHEALAPTLAALAGAREDEVITMNSLTINLHLLLASFYRPAGQRHVILMEQGAFPSDRYAVVSQLGWHGRSEAESLVELAPRDGEALLRDEDILAAILELGPRLALVLMPGIQYLSGQLYDLGAITRATHEAGAIAGLDLAHGIGNVPLQLHDWGVDFAVWCSYKYLNGGPGATAGAFIHQRHSEAARPRLAGWWGNDIASRFDFSPEFDPGRGAAGWQVSNGPILAMAPLRASLEQFAVAGLPALLARSRRLTAFLEARIDARLGTRLEQITPREPARRGAQLSLRLRGQQGQGRALFDRMIAAGLICDWREPDVIRLAPAPLYNTFEDCWRAVELIASLLD